MVFQEEWKCLGDFFIFFFSYAYETGLKVLYILKDLAYKEKSRLKALQNSSCADVYDLWAQN